jgi:hypothetical protein
LTPTKPVKESLVEGLRVSVRVAGDSDEMVYVGQLGKEGKKLALRLKEAVSIGGQTPEE